MLVAQHLKVVMLFGRESVSVCNPSYIFLSHPVSEGGTNRESVAHWR